MKTALLALSFVISNVSGPAYQAGSSVEVLTDDANIINTTALQDLSTDSSFRQSDFPKLSYLPSDVYGNTESAWQGITMTNGLKGYKYTYFYFYHPLCDAPKWVNSETNESSFSVSYRVTLSFSPNLGDYYHHSITEVDHSEDLRFWKFVCTDDFSRMDGLDYQAYDISEFELMNSDGFGGSNSCRVGKRFAWEKGSDGSLGFAVDDVETVSIDPFFDYWRIPGAADCPSLKEVQYKNTATSYLVYSDYVKSGINSGSASDYDGTLSYEAMQFTEASVANKKASYECSFACNSLMSFAESDVFYCLFPLLESYGDLVKAHLSFRVEEWLNLLVQHVLWDDNSNVQDNFMTNVPLDSGLLKDRGEKDVRLASGEANDPYGALTQLSSNPAGGMLYGDMTYLGQLNWLGYSDTFVLPAVQKVSPSYDGSWTAGDAKTSADNCFGFSDDTVSYLGENYSKMGVGSSMYCLRYYCNPSIFFRNQRGLAYPTDFSYFSLIQKCLDTDVLDLTFSKDGAEYTIGVVADSGDVVPESGAVAKNDSSFSFSWQWLLVILGLVLGFILVYSVVKYLMNRSRRQ